MGFYSGLLLWSLAWNSWAANSPISPVFAAHAAHCGAVLLLQHPNLERISTDQALDLIGPGFVGTSEYERIKVWFTQPVWRPWEYEIYAIRDRHKALEWSRGWTRSTDVVAHLLAGNLPPNERVPFSVESEANRVRELLSSEGATEGRVLGTAKQLPLDYTISFEALPTKMPDSFTFFVPAARHRETAQYALVIVSTLTPP